MKWAFFCFLVCRLVLAQNDPVPLARAHAHNDYEHKRPLFDALDHGFCSVEADIWLINDKLLVAHDEINVRSNRTLQALYLDPLRQRVKASGGRVYRGGPPISLLVDVKSNAQETYRKLRTVLQGYEDILTRFEGGRVFTNAITVIVSGNRARETMAAEAIRFCGLDGRLADLELDVSSSFIPWISDTWRSNFKWTGDGPFPAEEKQKLKQIVSRAHARGQIVRLWAAPSGPAAWSELLAAGVDLLNTDDLPEMKAFLLSRPGGPQ